MVVWQILSSVSVISTKWDNADDSYFLIFSSFLQTTLLSLSFGCWQFFKYSIISCMDSLLDCWSSFCCVFFSYASRCVSVCVLFFCHVLKSIHKITIAPESSHNAKNSFMEEFKIILTSIQSTQFDSGESFRGKISEMFRINFEQTCFCTRHARHVIRRFGDVDVRTESDLLSPPVPSVDQVSSSQPRSEMDKSHYVAHTVSISNAETTDTHTRAFREVSRQWAPMAPQTDRAWSMSSRCVCVIGNALWAFDNATSLIFWSSSIHSQWSNGGMAVRASSLIEMFPVCATRLAPTIGISVFCIDKCSDSVVINFILINLIFLFFHSISFV